MQDVVFELISDGPGQLLATAHAQHLQIQATNLEDLQHEAREALMGHFGPSHVAYRVRLRRSVRKNGRAQFARGCVPAAAPS
jgi:hypothetical protein